MPSCRICHLPIDKEKKDTWIMPSRGWYYHKECYMTWKENPVTNDDWIALIFDFLAHDLKVSYDYFLCKAQIEKFWKTQKINPKGIYFTLKYFYEIKGNSFEKGHGGLGIVPYVFTESKEYWVERERKKQGIIQQIEEEAKEKQIIRLKRRRENKEKYNLDEIGGVE